MPEDETLSKAELALIDKIVGALGMRSFQKRLWDKVEQAFGFTFRNTQVKYGFTHATPDPLALKYLKERVFILSDKTRDRLTGNLRWELLEGIRNTESISDIKKRLAPIFTKMHDFELERIARTETLNAMNAGRLEAYEASEVTHYKMWRAAINNKRTAEDSRRLHGQIQELGDPFVDPKTGEGVMHPPNRPNCRCAMIPLRKLPENVVYKSGQMYAADEMVGKIEINIGSLQKGKKRVWVKATSKRKGHYRKIKGAKKVEEPKIGFKDYYNSIDFSIGLNEYDSKYENIDWEYIKDSWAEMSPRGIKWHDSEPVKNFNEVVRKCVNNDRVYEDMLNYIGLEDSVESVRLGSALNIIFGTNDYIHGSEDTKNKTRSELNDDYLYGVLRMMKVSQQILDKMHPDKDKIKLFRGIRSKTANSVKESFKENGECGIDLGSLSSWTSSGLIPYEFAGKDGVVLNYEIDKKRIVICWAMYASKITKDESEFTIHGGSINLSKNNITWGLPL